MALIRGPDGRELRVAVRGSNELFAQIDTGTLETTATNQPQTPPQLTHEQILTRAAQTCIAYCARENLPIPPDHSRGVWDARWFYDNQSALMLHFEVRGGWRFMVRVSDPSSMTVMESSYEPVVHTARNEEGDVVAHYIEGARPSPSAIEARETIQQFSEAVRNSGTDFEAYRDAMLRDISAGIGIPAEMLEAAGQARELRLTAGEVIQAGEMVVTDSNGWARRARLGDMPDGIATHTADVGHPVHVENPGTRATPNANDVRLNTTDYWNAAGEHFTWGGAAPSIAGPEHDAGERARLRERARRLMEPPRTGRAPVAPKPPPVPDYLDPAKYQRAIEV